MASLTEITSIGTEALKVKAIPGFKRNTEVAKKIGGLLFYRFVCESNFVVLGKTVGIGPGLQDDNKKLAKPFDLHKILIANILKHI